MASAWCGLSGEPRPPRPPRSPTPRPSAPRPRPLGAAAGLYWAGAKVEARRNSGLPARRCSFGDRGRKGGYRRYGLRDSAPQALKAEGSIASPKGDTNTGWHRLRAPKIPAQNLGPPVKNTSWYLEWIADAHASSFQQEVPSPAHLGIRGWNRIPVRIHPEVSHPRTEDSTHPTPPSPPLLVHPISTTPPKKIPAEEDSSTEK